MWRITVEVAVHEGTVSRQLITQPDPRTPSTLWVAPQLKPLNPYGHSHTRKPDPIVIGL